MLDEAGLSYVTITASNQLDEYVIKSLQDQQAPIDVFGVGTSLVTCPPDAALDGVYKLAYADGKPRIKLSENLKKITLPDKKQVYRIMNGEENFFGADLISLRGEADAEMMHDPADPDKFLSIRGMKKEPLLHPVMEKGKRLHPEATLRDISAYSFNRLARLPQEHKRFENPHIYKVGITGSLRDLRNELKNQHKKPL
jgi:nicotinate phosphoribosyltransferase